MKDVVMPGLGMAMTEGTLLQWHKAAGEAVAEGELIAEIETDKSTVDLESPGSGVIGRQRVQPGAVVAVGTVLTRILEDGEQETEE